MRRKITFFISYSHEDKALADDFVRRLKVQLTPSARYEYGLWQDKALLVGEDWDREIREAMEQADLGLLLLSPAFLGSSYIARTELPVLLTRPVLPVLLAPVNMARQDMRGLKEKQIFALEAARTGRRAFAEGSSQQRARFVEALFEQIEARLDKLFAGTP